MIKRASHACVVLVLACLVAFFMLTPKFYEEDNHDDLTQEKNVE
jgi:hypothetical protein